MAENKRYENKVTVLGELKELEVREITTKKGVPMKMANISVQTGEGEVHRARMSAMEYFENDGKKEENKAYKAIETMQDEYVSLKDIAEKNLQDVSPTVVGINGHIENNVYQGRDGKLVEMPTIQANFVSRRNAKKEDYGVEFVFQTFALSSATRVTNKDGDETDSVRFKVAAIHRGMAQPFEVEATDEYGVAEWLEDNLEKGMTLTINGQWINKYILKQVERPNPAGIGKPIVDTKREIENRILVEGVSPAEDEESVGYITTEEMKDAMKKYEDYKVERQSASQEKKKQEVKKGVNIVKKSTTTNTSTLTDEDLPF
ncbi:hypothetical protein DJ466_07650 [Staphylococcus pseudintermedius]|uniref:hypothetical protein n=1 Tax=Staphylococcus pseudintermedius TaxID=283734 RepID=UPI000C1C5D0D|nr:hypothetical protein [Staphylococcus pseudintermedius]EHT8099298.1 hypothetical protein [Staphylococcus pseudintermedius]ELH4387749.1 hypothetical protein [Staphylococcus pseudintermedius]TOY73272.1 hypothetical protein DJ466_07650 [Staphylococcus pseudintermedius]WMZ76808.1 hypothetical protein QS426_01905 [Staphylococcus pseudintermedius]HAR5655893.1 hypothetical protein [Staphylococcus pseudintermedius]